VLISTVHNIYEGGRLRELLYRVSDPLTDLTTFISRAAAERYLRIGAVSGQRPWKVIPNGVDTREFNFNAQVRAEMRNELGIDNAFVWLAAGRLEEQKNYPFLLRAFSNAIRGLPESVLLIAGVGPFQKELMKLAGELELDSSVRFLGLREDVHKLMNAADAFVISSSWEGLPMALLEASASELPVIATDVGGNRDVIVAGKSGFLVKPNDIDDLANSMGAMSSLTATQLSEMGRAGRSYIEAHYSMENIVNTWEDVYRGLLEEKHINVRGE
jgi:glycosyltransferase involved in cell wall biosynthesis